mmetsp:Transcript_22139/g.10523  ORF Transcript_22139/g.10523 Transcript_22139/m.10523 type:complete len:140 (+) Transcript_22139:2433-2852(+)
MGKVFRLSNRETNILSKIESSKGYLRRQALNSIANCIEPFSNAIAMKLVESNLVETTNKNIIEKQITKCLEKLSKADDFDIDYKIAPLRQLVSNPNVVSLYLTSFVIEDLINHQAVVDIYGSDDDIYSCIHEQVIKFLL